MSAHGDEPGLSLRIGQLAELVGVTPKTIRHYHKIGLLPHPKRGANNYRRYGIVDLYRLDVILRLKDVGFGLADIAAVLGADDPDAVLHKRLASLDRALGAELQELKGRRQKVRGLLGAEVGLKRLDQPEVATSWVHEMLMSTLAGYAEHLPEGMRALDKAMLARLERFRWGEAYDGYWTDVARSMGDDPKPLRIMSEAMVEAAELEVDDDRLPTLAAEVVKGLRSIGRLPAAPELPGPLPDLFREVTARTVNDLLSPAQKRLVSLIREGLHPRP